MRNSVEIILLGKFLPSFRPLLSESLTPYDGCAMNVKLMASRLKKARLRSGLTQAQLAESAGLSESTIAAAESGRRSVRLENLVEMCRALGTTVEQLVTGGEGAVMPVAHEAQFRGALDAYLGAERDLWLSFFEITLRRSGSEAPELAEKNIKSKARVRPNLKT
jgi:transcriptional regulator with XRE-family HTH domain